MVDYPTSKTIRKGEKRKKKEKNQKKEKKKKNEKKKKVTKKKKRKTIMFKRKIRIDIEDRKSFIENNLCRLCKEIYPDVHQLRYSKSHRRKERVIIIIRTDTEYLHRKQYNVVEITGKDIYETMCLILNKVKQEQLSNLIIQTRY